MANQGGRVYYWDDYTNDDDRRAMWADPNVKPLWEKRLDATGKVPFMMERVGKKMVPYLTSEEMHAVASIIESRHFSGTRLAGLAGSEGDLAAAIARVESAWQPLAYRFENKLGEASTGLMQVLQSTSMWLEKDMGFDVYHVDVSNPDLYSPFKAVYFGMAYLSYLSTYKGIPHDEEFVVRCYNGGPRGMDIPGTETYWSKYLQAKQEIFAPAPFDFSSFATCPGSPLISTLNPAIPQFLGSSLLPPFDPLISQCPWSLIPNLNPGPQCPGSSSTSYQNPPAFMQPEYGTWNSLGFSLKWSNP